MATILQTMGPGRPRELGRIEEVFLHVLSVVTATLFVAVAFGTYVTPAILLYWFLGVILALAFLTISGNPLRPQKGSLFGWAAALLALAMSGYFIAMQPVYELRLPMIDALTLADKVAAITMIALVLEATRRTIGATLVVIVGIFLIYGIWGHHLEGPFSHRPLDLQEMLDQLVFSTNGLFGPALSVAAFLVLVFVIFGALLDRCGGGDFFFDLANSLVGRQVGGPAKVAVVSSGLYGSISGSPTADVVTTGSFTIPIMIRSGLSRTYAAAVEATASTGGALLPPVMGTAAFLMSDFTGIPYGTIAIAAVFPAVLYYISVFLAVHLRAQAQGLKPLSEGEAPRFATVIAHNWYFFIPIFLLVWFVLAYDRPVFSAAVALASLVPIALWRQRNPITVVRTIFVAFDDGMRRMISIGVACAIAGLVVGTLAMTDLTGKISSGMFALARGSELLTLMIATLVIIVLGMGMPTPAVYALSAVLAAPALLALGIPLLPAHLFIVYFASMSAITPPVAVAAFAAGSIAQANPMTIAVLCCRLAMVAFIIPFVFIYHHGVLLIGTPTDVALAIGGATLAVVALVGAVEGYAFGPIGLPLRALLLLAGVLLMLPALAPTLAGAVLLITIAAWLGMQSRAEARRDTAHQRIRDLEG